jgi:hypothetical protein
MAAVSVDHPHNSTLPIVLHIVVSSDNAAATSTVCQATTLLQQATGCLMRECYIQSRHALPRRVNKPTQQGDSEACTVLPASAPGRSCSWLQRRAATPADSCDGTPQPNNTTILCAAQKLHKQNRFTCH